MIRAPFHMWVKRLSFGPDVAPVAAPATAPEFPPEAAPGAFLDAAPGAAPDAAPSAAQLPISFGLRRGWGGGISPMPVPDSSTDSANRIR